MDLDRFREINDTFGHGRGDRVLQQFGERLRHVTPESDTIARLLSGAPLKMDLRFGRRAASSTLASVSRGIPCQPHDLG
jgi:hypothetical protein